MQPWALFLLLSIFFSLSIPPAATGQSSADSDPVFMESDSESPIQPRLFGLSATSGIVSQQPWPVVSFATLRLLQPGTSWDQLNPSNGQYDFTLLDSYLESARTHRISLLLILFRTPRWASSKPGDTSCIDGPGSCAPPNDLNPDGSGSNQHWKDFVTAVANHSVNSGYARIRAYEIWNEPHNLWEWNGTYAQLVRMASDAYSIIKTVDPDASVHSPSFAWQTEKVRQWMAGYFAAGGGQYADKIDVHGYVFSRNGTFGWPENMATYVPAFFDVLKQYGQKGKPVWDSEANWGRDKPPKRHFDNPDLQAAWVARAYLLHASYHISRFYWFGWNTHGIGQLWKPDPNDPHLPGTLLKTGIAYQQVHDWMVGATINQTCSADGTIWTCGFSRPGGYVAEAVWDTSQSCSQTQCTTVPYPVDAQYIKYLTLSGDVVPITGTTVPIGAKPILLENQ